jgi:hypothetical protein
MRPSPEGVRGEESGGSEGGQRDLLFNLSDRLVSVRLSDALSDLLSHFELLCGELIPQYVSVRRGELVVQSPEWVGRERRREGKEDEVWYR